MAKERLPISCPPSPKDFKVKLKDKEGKEQEYTIKYPSELHTWFETVRTMLDVAYGVRREAEGLRFVTMQELVNSGLMSAILSNGVKLQKSNNLTGSLEVDLPNVVLDDRIPDQVSGFTVTPTFKNFILDWTIPTYPNHSHTEIWRNGSNDLATAKQLGETGGGVYSDNVGGTGTTMYYWVRHVGLNGKRGQFTATSASPATYGTTGKITGSSEITSATITNALIENLAVDTAKIANLAVTDAKVSDLNVNKLTTGTITSKTITLGDTSDSIIKSSNYSAGSAGWQINGLGDAEFNTLVVRDGNIGSSVPKRLKCYVLETFGPQYIEDASSYQSGVLNLVSTGTVPSAHNYSFSIGTKRITNLSSSLVMKIRVDGVVYIANTSATAKKYGNVSAAYRVNGGTWVGAGSDGYFALSAGSGTQSIHLWGPSAFSVPASSYIEFGIFVDNQTPASDGQVMLMLAQFAGDVWHE